MTVGNLVKIGPDNLVLADAERGLVLELPRTSITRVEVGHQRRQTKKGLLIGLAIGAVMGALTAVIDKIPSTGGSGEPLSCPAPGVSLPTRAAIARGSRWVRRYW